MNSIQKHRRNMRLKDYDYSQPGAYFVTICTHNREFLFGHVLHDEMKLNGYAEIVTSCWRDLSRHFSHLELDAFIVMPNHLHGIIIIKDGQNRDCPSLSEIVKVFKTSSSRRINGMRGTKGVPVWQRGFWDHVIRNQEAFNRIHDYIMTNPLRWYLDRENPEQSGKDDFEEWLEKEGKHRP